MHDYIYIPRENRLVPRAEYYFQYNVTRARLGNKKRRKRQPGCECCGWMDYDSRREMLDKIHKDEIRFWVEGPSVT